MILLAAFAAMTAVWSAEAGAKKPRKAKVSLTVNTANQAGLLKAGKLTVTVRSTGKAKVKLSAAKGGNGKLFRKKAVNFKKAGKRKVGLALTAAGKKALGKCGAQPVKVVAKYRRGKKKASASRTKRLAKAANRCAKPVEYVEVPLGEHPDRCDFLDSTVCLQPFPNDYYTKADQSTPTGRRLDIHPEASPTNRDGKHVEVTDINRADGFSPGNAIVLKVPGLDTPAAFQNTGLVPIDNLRAYEDPSQAVVVINARTGERQPIWAELDSNPTTVDPIPGGDIGGINANPDATAEVNLIVRPAENFDYGERYIVAFRNLKDAAGKAIESPIGFRAYRDKLPTKQDAVENRRGHMEQVIGDVVSKAGVERSSLYMAWDFTVASQQSVTSRALQIRDDAFKRLGDNDLSDRKIQGASPQVVIDAVCNAGDSASCGTGGNGLGVPGGSMLRYVEGHLKDVPCYLNQDGCLSGSTFKFKSDGSVDFDPSYKMNVPFRCIVPTSVQPGGAGTAVTPGQTGIYGHGLLGDYKQATSVGPQLVSSGSGGIWCGANWDGFSSSDLVPTILPSLGDMSNFNKAADRMQQGFVNFMLLQRAMVHPDGFSALPAFQLDDDGNPSTDPVPVIDTGDFPDTRGQYMGISQGGIMGGALMALSPDSDYGVLGVPGMNYSTLLQRSVDSDRYFKWADIGLYANYTNLAEHPILLGLVQLLWDRGEANGYAKAMTSDPLPNTPQHDVLLRVAFGDHQVANVTAEVEARSIGASIYAPALNPGRHWEQNPFMGLNQQNAFPFSGGSMLVYYDSGPESYMGTEDQGIATPPDQNVPPRKEWGFGGDPHEHPRRSADGVDHAITFLRDGSVRSCAVITPEVSDPTDAHCYANGYTGP